MGHESINCTSGILRPWVPDWMVSQEVGRSRALWRAPPGPCPLLPHCLLLALTSFQLPWRKQFCSILHSPYSGSYLVASLPWTKTSEIMSKNNFFFSFKLYMSNILPWEQKAVRPDCWKSTAMVPTCYSWKSAYSKLEIMSVIIKYV